MSIKSWPEGERPREKLLAHGAEHLSDGELLAIFLRTGVAGMDAVELSRTLLHQFGGLRPLLAASQADFCKGHGLGQAAHALAQIIFQLDD